MGADDRALDQTALQASLLRPGTVFAGRYRVVRPLGRGGMGAVFQAEDERVGDSVALKLVTAADALESEALDRFCREVRLARRVSHRNVARIHDLEQHDGVHFLTMEYIEGRDLQAVIDESGPMPAERAGAIALDTCDGLAAAHEAGVIHRDLKPANVLLETSGRVVLTDFGIARTAADEGTALHTAGVLGTPMYMAPEQVKGAPADERTDVYSVGELLYEMLTGAPPFCEATPIATAIVRLERPPPDPRERVAVADPLAELVLSCLQREPDRRPEGAADVARQLRELLGRPIAPPPVLHAAPRTTDSLAARSKPSLAVLPFTSMGTDAEDEYFADGITEDVITELSRFAGMFVIARNSAFTYKGRALRVQDVGRELGVGYVVEGSVRRSDNRVRVSVTLSDAETGRQLWAERYDRKLLDIFDVQDEITQAIVAVLPERVELAAAERVKRKPPRDMVAYECLLAGKVHYHRATPEDFRKALELLDRAIGLEPDSASAWAWKACATGQGIARGWVEDPDQALTACLEALDRAMSLDPTDVECQRLSCEVSFQRHDLEQARLHHERAFELNPNDPRLVAQKAELLTWLGRPQEAISWLEKAMLIDPYGGHKRNHLLGRALYHARRYGEAAEAYRKIASPMYAHEADLAACYAQLGRRCEAGAHAQQALRLEPHLSVAGYLGTLPYQNAADREHHREGLVGAGLPPD